MDKKKVLECIKEVKGKLEELCEMLEGDGKKEYTSLDQVRDKAYETESKEKDESQAV